MNSLFRKVGVACIACAVAGCAHPVITAVNLDKRVDEREGIPYYLPKPYLIVSKNVRYIPTPTVGLTQTVPIPSSFQAEPTPPAASKPAGGEDKPKSGGQTPDDKKPKGDGDDKQPTAAVSMFLDLPDPTVPTDPAPAPVTNGASSKPKPAGGGSGDKPAGDDKPASPGNVYGNQVLGPASIAVVPPASISDGLVPQTFYTYQVVYLPDLTEKYGLRIEGGAGEMRATANIVNGWMFTGPGPIYMRDSFTSQNVAVAGQAAAAVTEAVGKVALSALGVPSSPSAPATGGQTTAKGTTGGGSLPPTIRDYAELYVFELTKTRTKHGVQVAWKPVAGLSPVRFKRDILELERTASINGGAGSPDGAANEVNARASTEMRHGLEAKGWKFTAQGVNVAVEQDAVNADSKVFVVTLKPSPSLANNTQKARLAADAQAVGEAYASQAGIRIANRSAVQVNIQ